MSNPISGTVNARPDRPDYPWEFVVDSKRTFWGTGTYPVAWVEDDDTHWSLCITSIHVTG